MSKSLPVSPLAPAEFPALPAVKGVQFATAAAGIKYKNRTDVMLVALADGTAVAGVYTKSLTRSAAVLDCQAKTGLVAEGGAAILVNSGNSNAFTGAAGAASVERLTEQVAAKLGISESRVFTASTGVIGEKLPDERISAQLDHLVENLNENGAEGAAKAIMTTDTFPKGAARSVTIGGKTVQIIGFAKGSGMIAPDMATMLAYIFTDAKIEQSTLQSLLAKGADLSFNAITVDSDTSTSDTVMLAATGASGVEAGDSKGFADALNAVLLDLAHQIVRDGEGATKFVEIRVTGAKSVADAHTHAMAIANSPLVKTAIAGEDPNWGRIVMAIGKSGAYAERDSISIRFGDILVAQRGWVAESYSEAAGADYMRESNLVISVDLAVGSAEKTVWTCDLTHGYISINADYRS